jgi:hypothetical protein
MLSYATKSILWLLIQTVVVVSSIIVIQTSGWWTYAIRIHFHEMLTITIHVNESIVIWKQFEVYAFLCYEVNSMTTHTNFFSNLIHDCHTDKWSMKLGH